MKGKAVNERLVGEGMKSQSKVESVSFPAKPETLFTANFSLFYKDCTHPGNPSSIAVTTPVDEVSMAMRTRGIPSSGS